MSGPFLGIIVDLGGTPGCKHEAWVAVYELAGEPFVDRCLHCKARRLWKTEEPAPAAAPEPAPNAP